MKRQVRPGRSADGGPEDQTNGRIHETSSPAEPGAAGYRGQAPIVRRRRDAPETAHPAPAVPAETLSQVLRRAGPPPRTEETTP